jgi:hypothetical protein
MRCISFGSWRELDGARARCRKGDAEATTSSELARFQWDFRLRSPPVTMLVLAGVRRGDLTAE